MEMKSAAVSVIIPMYNVSSSIGPTLDCILKQGMDNAEYIFIDDCSSDDSLLKIQRWIEAHKDCGPNFVLLHHEENRGVACARNTGLENAQGEYVYWLDADDILADGALPRMHKAAKDANADILDIEWYLEFETNKRHMRQAHADNGAQLLDNLCYGVSRWNLWLFMIRRELIESLGVRFTPGDNMGEDMMAMLKLAATADKVVTLHEPLYHYIQTNPNAITRQWTDEHRRQVTANLENAERFLRKVNGTKYSNQIECLKLNLKLPLLISDQNADFEKWQNWWNEANDFILKNPLLPFRTKLLQLAATKRQYWLLKLYYHLIIKTLYGKIYK